MRNRELLAALCLAALLSGLSGCGREETGYLPQRTEGMELTSLEDEAVALAQLPPAVPAAVEGEQGALVKENDRAQIDYSHTREGYVAVRVLHDSGKRWKALVKGPTATSAKSRSVYLTGIVFRAIIYESKAVRKRSIPCFRLAESGRFGASPCREWKKVASKLCPERSVRCSGFSPLPKRECGRVRPNSGGTTD